VRAAAEQGNVASAMIQLENSQAPEELRRVVLPLYWLHDLPGQPWMMESPLRPVVTGVFGL